MKTYHRTGGRHTGDYFLTDLGRRVLLHLIYAEKFVDLLAEAHKKFQTTPRF